MKIKERIKNISKKTSILLVLGLLMVFGATAGLLSYFGIITTTINVTQPITIDGEGCDDRNCIDELTLTAGETGIGNSVKISNSGYNDVDVQITSECKEGERLCGDDEITISYVGKLELTTKDISNWQPTETKKTTVTYTLVGDVFNADVETGEGYELVYAKDYEDRFDPEHYATIIKLGDIDGDLPYSDDWNVNPVPDYCELHNTFDDYEHCSGAKLWIVKSNDIDGSSLSWANMGSYLWETDLIRYFDNTEGRITIPAGSYIEFYPEFSSNKLLEGTYTVTTSILP